MAKHADVCEHVGDVDSIRVSGDAWIPLARVSVPETNTPAGEEAKKTFEGIILSGSIFYELVTTDSDGCTFAGVWFCITNINDHMRTLGYK